MTDKSAEFELVKSLRATVKTVACGVSEKTKVDYCKKFERMQRLKLWPEQIGKTRRSYFAYRAALLFGIADLARQALRLRDSAKDPSPERDKALKTLLECQKVFDRYPPDPERLHIESGSTSFTWCDVASENENSGQTPARNSKKYTLTALNRHADWRQKLFAEISPMYKMAAAVAAVTGCRPGELEKGIRVKRVDDDLVFLIDGLKVSDVAGQAQRLLRIRIESVEAQYLANNLTSEPTTIKIRSAKSFTEAVAKAGKTAFPKLKERLSPYVWRHSLASDLKSGQIDSDTIAKALGHRVSRTQEHYGRSCHGGSPVALVDVQASLAIRDNARQPMMSTPSISPRFG